MAANKSAEKLRCAKCLREVIVIKPGEGPLICCHEVMKPPEEVLTVNREFVQVWVNRYAEEFKGEGNISTGKADLDWMFKEKESARATLQKAGLWKRAIDDASDEAWLEYVKILRELSTNLNVAQRALSKALFTYGKLGDNFKRCPYCNGTGKVDGPAKDIILNCPVCKGGCYNFIPTGSKLCTDCKGAGKFINGTEIAYTKKLCQKCEGKGWIQE